MRDARIELYRCLMMFGICLLHSVSQGGYGNVYLARALCSCVVGFVVITGWFGIGFKWMKVVRLLGTAVWCAVVSCLVCGAPGMWFKTLLSYWFVWAYLALMLLSPIVDAAIERVKEGQCSYLKLLVPAAFLVFGWGTLAVNHFTIRLTPQTPGLESYSGLTLLGIYVVVRLLRVSGVLAKLSLGGEVAIAVIGFVFVLAGVSQYNSPFALMLALGVFLLVIRAKPIGGKIVNVVSPSMFAVYLYHTGPFFGVIRTFEQYLVEICGLPVFVTYFVMASSIFCGAIILDLPRRLVARILTQKCMSFKIVRGR